MPTKPTDKEIKEATEELMEAMMEVRKASQVEDNAKLAKIKAHNRLILAQEAIRSINYYSY